MRVLILSILISLSTSLGFQKISITIKTEKYPPLNFNIDSSGMARAIYFLQKEIPSESLLTHRNDLRYYNRNKYVRVIDSIQFSKHDLCKLENAVRGLRKNDAMRGKNFSTIGVYLEIDDANGHTSYFFGRQKKTSRIQMAYCAVFKEERSLRGLFYSFVQDNFRISCENPHP